MGFEIVEKHRGVISKVLNGDGGKAFADLLRESFVDVDLMGKTDRETVENVAKHDMAVYLIEMGKLKDE